jgi:hypothetical protein
MVPVGSQGREVVGSRRLVEDSHFRRETGLRVREERSEEVDSFHFREVVFHHREVTQIFATTRDLLGRDKTLVMVLPNPARG